MPVHALKHLVGQLLTPFSIAMACLLAGAILIWMNRRIRLGKYLVAAGILILMLFGNSMLARYPVHAIEGMYLPFTLNEAGGMRCWKNGTLEEWQNESTERQKTAGPTNSPTFQHSNIPNTQSVPPCWIVVLGTGYEPELTQPANNQVSEVFLARFIEGARIQRLLPGARLLISVSGEATKIEKRALVTELCTSLGIAGSPPVIIGDAGNTFGEAKRTKDLVGSVPVILVTSALHMHRAVTIFRAAGLDVTPAPTDYHAVDTGYTVSDILIPCPGGLRLWNILIHEALGMVYGKLRGQW